MEVQQVAEGLWRWVTAHPEWTPESDWPRDVGCLYLEADDAVTLIDPLIPSEPDERERFLTHLERDLGRAGRPLAIAITVHWHRRSADELAERFGAPVWTKADGGPVPGGVEALDADRKDEVLFWIPAHQALAAGDVLLADEAGGVRMCPEDWLPDGVGHAELAESLRPLLDRPLERILVSHGEPVLAGGRDALARALDA